MNYPSFSRLFSFFAMGALMVAPASAFAEAPFTDLYTYDWSFEAVYQMSQQGIFEGDEWGYFDGIYGINRAEAAKVLVLANGLTDEEIAEEVDRYVDTYGVEAAGFTDVDPTLSSDELWYVDYVIYAKSQGWMTGYEDGGFKPEENLTVFESFKIVVEALWGTPSNYYAGENWYDRYVGLLTHFQVVEENYSSDSMYGFPFIESYLYDGGDEMVRTDFAELVYRVTTVLEEGEGSWVAYDPYLTLDEYAEMYDVTLVLDAEDATLSVYDPYFYFQFEDLMLDAETPWEDYRVSIKNPSGAMNGYYTEWTLLYPSSYDDVSFFTIKLYDAGYFDDTSYEYAYDYYDYVNYGLIQCTATIDSYIPFDMDDLLESICGGDVRDNLDFEAYGTTDTCAKGDDCEDDDWDDYWDDWDDDWTYEYDYTTEVSDTEGYMTFIDNTYGVSVDYPDTWELYPWYYWGIVAEFYPPYDEETFTYETDDVTILVYPFTDYPDYEGMDTAAYGDSVYDEWLALEDVLTIERGERSFAGVTGEYLHATSTDEAAYEMYYVYAVIDDVVYSLYYIYDLGSTTYWDYFEHMMDTFATFDVEAVDTSARAYGPAPWLR